MLAPMSAVISDNEVSFKHLGGMVRIACESVPTEAVALDLCAEGMTICGDFPLQYGEDMEMAALNGNEGNTVRINFTSGRSAIDFNVPVPVGEYSKISAMLVNDQDEVLLEWDVLTDAEVV